MIVAKIQVNGVCARVVYRKIITAGMIGAKVEILYTDPVWDGLKKTVVFQGSGTKDVVTQDQIVTIPAEVIAQDRVHLRVGVYGVNAESVLAIPTLWAELGTVQPGADPSGDITTDQALPVWAQIQGMIGNLDELDTAAKNNLVAAVNEALKKGGSSWNELKDKPFYLEKTLVVELTKDDFTVNGQDGNIKYIYRSTPKLDWFTSAESIAFEIEIVDTNGRRYTATQDSIDIVIGNDNTDDDYEYWYCFSDLFDIVSGVDLDFYDDEYYYKDEWGVLVKYGGIEFSQINIKIYRVDVKKIPKICLDAAIGKTAITVGSVLEDSEAEMAPSAFVPALRIPISPYNDGEYIYYDRVYGSLRISGDLFPYNGKIDYMFRKETPTTAGSSISFDISSEGDTLWDTIGYNSHWSNGGYLFFTLWSGYLGGGKIEFLSRGSYGSVSCIAVAASTLGHLYTVVFKYTNNYKTLNVTIKCVVE